jgi:ribosomal protein L28
MVATKRRFNPNLQKVRIFVGSAPRRVYEGRLRRVSPFGRRKR